MDRHFKSKVDWWFHLLLWLLIAACVKVVLGQNMIVLGVVLVITAFTIHVFLNTYYVITSDGRLVLHCGLFPKKEIQISDIEALEPSIFPTFSYALSLNRIIIWKKPDLMWMLISPKNEKEFIKTLKGFNPDIQIKKNETLL